MQQKERKESSSDHSSNKSNFAHTSIVEVHGDIAGLEKESPEMYLENEGRSGDGEVEEINTPPQVNFRDPEGSYIVFISNTLCWLFSMIALICYLGY